MRKINRRQFIRHTSLLATSGVALSAMSVPARAFGANDRVHVAVIGCGGQGNGHIDTYAKQPHCELAWVVDADVSRADAAKDKIKKNFETDVQSAQDARVMLEDKNVDAVSVVTCNHWHSLMGIWAIQAGKHVYVEKPCSQNLFEGRQLAEAAKKYGKCVQHGTQRRSDNSWLRGATAWASGKYGKPTALQAFANRARGLRNPSSDRDPPANIDWNLWVGPAAMVPFNDNYVPYNWHWFWNFGNGEIGNNGVHYFDLCRIALTAKDPGVKHPTSAVMFGSRFANLPDANYTDAAQTPNIQLGVYDYAGIPLIFQSCNYAAKDSDWQARETAYFVTEDGYFEGDRFYPNQGDSFTVKSDDVEIVSRQPGGPYGNFLDCVRNGTPEKLNAPISEGHYSAAVCHLGNLSYRLGETASLADCRSAVGDNAIMQRIIDETLANLSANWNGKLDVEKTILWTLGKKVCIDSETEQFPDAAANALLTRPERAPFVVPKEV